MITVAAVETDASVDGLRAAFAASGAYLDAVCAKTNIKARRQSLAGLQALLLLLLDRGVDPRPLVLARAAGGKPYIENSGLKFCVSHSDGLAVCALAGHEVGVDVERVRPRENIETFAKRFFSAEEYAIIMRANDKNDAFFSVWTKKEASLKLLGRGIDADLAETDTARGIFSVFGITAADGDYIAAVAGGETVRAIGGLVWKKRK